MTSIDELEAHLLEIDKDFKHDDTFAKGSQLAGVSFDKTLNALTLTGEPKDFSVFIPWKVWTPGLEFTDDNAPKLGDSALQEAFKHVLERGRFLADNKMCFIDIAHLWDGVSEPFFEEGSSTSTDEKTKSVAKAIADVIDGVEGDSSEITVRFLVGDFTMTKHTLESATNFINNIFWPGKQPLVKNQKNARLYIGQYSPGWDFNADKSPLNLLRSQAANIRELAEWLKSSTGSDLRLGQAADVLAKLKDDVVLKFLEGKGTALSWNHGKILAVNGKTLMTGGANFAHTNASNQYSIIEQSCKMKGDAAVSAHVWQDYFFSYLNKQPTTDDRSFVKCTNLNGPFNNWEDRPAPMSTAETYKIKKTSNTGAKVLSIAQLGDWHGPMADLRYPVQIVQLLKDLILNIAWSRLSKVDETADDQTKKLFKMLPIQGIAMILVNALFAEKHDSRDQLLQAIGRPLINPYKDLQINPNAWASRMTRLNAIANATESVVICQQRIVLNPNDDQQKAYELMNDTMLLKGEQRWDGMAWPYDLLIALCYAIMADKDGNGSAKVEIVLSTDGGHDENADKDGGWGDKMLIDDFKKRLKMVLRGMAFLANLPYVMSLARTAGNETAKKVTADQEAKLQATAKLFTKNADFSLGMLVLEEGLAYETGQPLFASFDQYVDNRVTLGRVLKGHEMAFNAQAGNLKDWQKKAHVNNHSKVVCVDDKLLYIGSDNIYPSYNEEHGVWIDDDATIKAWKEKIWTELWDHRTIR